MINLPTLGGYILTLLKVADEEHAEVNTVKLQKIFFLLEKEKGVKLDLNFEPELFGPYSEKLMSEIKRLTKEGKIRVEVHDIGEPLTGIIFGQSKIYHAGDGVVMPADLDNKVIDFFKEWAKKSLWEILGYVYKKYPEYFWHPR